MRTLEQPAVVPAAAPAPLPKEDATTPFHDYARFTAGAAFLVLIAGGLVTSTGSGLAVPDWPLSFGTMFPRMVGGVRFEHGHRVIAGTVGLLTLFLAGWAFKRGSSRLVKGLASAAACGILLQAVLGGMTVLFKLPAPISAAHACLGQTVFCLLLLTAQASSPWYESAAKTPTGLWKLGAAAFCAVYVQLILGAVLRHAGTVFAFHAGWALMVSTVLLLLIGRTFDRAYGVGALTRPAWLLAALLPSQVALGILSYLVRYTGRMDMGFYQAAILTTAHVVTGAAILGTCALYTLRAYRLEAA